MELLYISNSCSDKKYSELFSHIKNKPAVQANKFNRLIAEGLATNDNVKVTILSKLPLTKQNYKKLYFRGEDEVHNNVRYKYMPLVNLGPLNLLWTFAFSFFYSLYFSVKAKESVIIVDVLNISIGLGATLAYKIRRMKSIGIVTDLPKYIGGKVTRKMIEKVINNCTMYVLLTQLMNDIINKNEKPYVVIEGISDIKLKSYSNNLKDKYQKKIIIYAGSFDKRYGILKLIDAFKLIHDEDIELWIFGQGDAEQEIITEIQKDKRIFFGGMRLNKEIIEIETKATLLINPRPSSEELTKYSFPSKTMEYMSTGTPVLTTKLEGIPKEYHEYIYLFDDESIENMSNKIKKLLSKPKIELHQLGLKAKEYVINEKNNIVQGNKIMDMIKKGENYDKKR